MRWSLFVSALLLSLPATAELPIELSATINPPFGAFRPENPTALAISPAGDLYLLDARLACVTKLSFAGEFTAQIGGPGSNAEQFADPADLCVNSGLDVFVADRGNDRIVRLDRRLTYLAEFSTMEGTPANLSFENPLSVLLGPRGDLFIADGGNDRILKIAPNNQPLFSFGAYGSERDALFQPRRIELDDSSGIWVLEGRGKVNHFDEFGGFIAAISTPFARSLTGLAVGHRALWVCADSALWVWDRSTHTGRTLTRQTLGLPQTTRFVDLALHKDQLYVLDVSGAIYRFRIISQP